MVVKDIENVCNFIGFYLTAMEGLTNQGGEKSDMYEKNMTYRDK